MQDVCAKDLDGLQRFLDDPAVTNGGSGTAPIIGEGIEVYSNPLPHVLILTAILVSVATTAVGLALVVSLLGALLPDLSEVVGLVMQVVFYAAPIVYPLALVQSTGVRTVIQLNPLTPIAGVMRTGLVGAEAPGAALPIAASQQLHVLRVVGLVDDLHAKQGFDHVFHGQQSLDAAVLVDDDRQTGQGAPPRRGHRFAESNFSSRGAIMRVLSPAT